jgi:ABC-type multidrug transport system fused ATPase/permease subunit
MVSGERQASRIRSLYLKAMLRQDVTFFDKETTTGEVIGRLSGDTILIHEAIGEKVSIGIGTVDFKIRYILSVLFRYSIDSGQMRLLAFDPSRCDEKY